MPFSLQPINCSISTLSSLEFLLNLKPLAGVVVLHLGHHHPDQLLGAVVTHGTGAVVGQNQGSNTLQLDNGHMFIDCLELDDKTKINL